MEAWIWVAIVVVVLVALGVWGWMALRRRSARLRERFGPEYDRTVGGASGRLAGERDLAARERRREQLVIRPLHPMSRQRYAEAWKEAQARFVDDPVGAVGAADRLVADVMRERGYPMKDFEQRAADVSVDHPEVVENYRVAHGIAEQQEDAGTEDLRMAMVRYRSLFEELLGDEEEPSTPADGRTYEERIEAQRAEEASARERAEAARAEAAAEEQQDARGNRWRFFRKAG